MQVTLLTDTNQPTKPAQLLVEPERESRRARIVRKFRYHVSDVKGWLFLPTAFVVGLVMGRLAAFFLFCAMLTCRASQGGTVFVNNLIGDDRANGLDQDVIGTQGGPVATVARALRIAKASDTIWIANTGTPYDESILIDWPGQGGTGLYPLVIDGHGAVFRGTRRVPADVWQRVGEGTYRYQPYRKGHYQLLVGGAPAAEAKVQRFQ